MSLVSGLRVPPSQALQSSKSTQWPVFLSTKLSSESLEQLVMPATATFLPLHSILASRKRQALAGTLVRLNTRFESLLRMCVY